MRKNADPGTGSMRLKGQHWAANLAQISKIRLARGNFEESLRLNWKVEQAWV